MIRQLTILKPLIFALSAVTLTTTLAACSGADNPKDFNQEKSIDETPADKGESPAPSPSPVSSSTPSPSPSPTPTETVEIKSVELTGASEDGTSGEILVSLDTNLNATRTAETPIYAIVEIFNSNNESIVKSNAVAINATQVSYQIPVSVPSFNDDLTAKVHLITTPSDATSSAINSDDKDFSVAFARTETILSDITGLELVLVPGSYSSEVVGTRRVHYFSAQVFDQDRQSINGLEGNTRQYFTASEDSIIDVESGVTVSSKANRLTVYMVMDVSSSITTANADETLLEAATRTAISLSEFSEFDYREFSDDARKITSLKALNFEEDKSATALYRAVDTVITDITNTPTNSNDKVIIVFTDGKDLASRNHYPELPSLEAVLEYVNGRLGQVKTDLSTTDSGSLMTYFVGLGEEIDVPALEKLALTGGGKFLLADSEQDLLTVFSELSNLIQSTYRLEYSSQQLPDDTVLELKVEINGVTDSVTVKQAPIAPIITE